MLLKGGALWRHPVYRIGRWALLGAGLATLLIVAPKALATQKLLATDDFVQYWAAGRANLLGDNPYDPDTLAAWQQHAGRTTYVTDAATIVWNPPWIMALLMPFGALPYVWGRVAWYLVHVALIAASARSLWLTFGSSQQSGLLALLLTFTFVPTLTALQVGQLGPVLLFVTVAFLLASRRRRWAVAGACLAFLSVKPQLFHLLFLVALLWSVAERQYRFVIGGAVFVAVFLGIGLSTNPAVVSQYAHALRTYPPVAWATPTVGGVLRHLLGDEHLWLQGMPPLVGGVWAGLYWWHHRADWRWSEHLPVLVTASVLTAPYSWSYDLVLLTLPMLYVMRAVLRDGDIRMLWADGAGLIYLIIAGLMVVQQGFVHNDFWTFWYAPAFSAWYFWARSRRPTPVAEGMTLR